MKHVRSFCVLIFILPVLLLSSAFARTATPKESVVSSSSVKFKIKNAGFTVDGTFSDLKAKIFFDAADISASTIEAVISANTVNTGNGTRDGHLKGEKYFNTVKYPKISLKSNSFSKNGNTYTGRFKLTIRETTKEIIIPFTYIEKEGIASFKGSFTINRRDYGVGGSSIIMADNVTVVVEVNTVKK